MIFSKYEGAGNDFILIDNRSLHFDPTLVSTLCDRRRGIGADGLILLQLDTEADLRMRIFNSDGSEAESCGNGLRCLAHFAKDLNLPFERIATQNQIVLASFQNNRFTIRLGSPTKFCLNLPLTFDGTPHTVHLAHIGVPHLVLFVSDLPSLDLPILGKKIRFHPAFAPQGVNVNFAHLSPEGSLSIRTYEKGIEAETLSCGTGAAAVACIASQLFNLTSPLPIKAPGGHLEIQFSDTNFSDLSLTGPTRHVFSGEYCL